MTTIDPSQRLLDLMRVRVARARAGAAGARPSAQAGDSEPAALAMVQRLQAIGGDDPQRNAKAVRLFLEAQVAGELGPAVVGDPLFPQMLDAVQEQMNACPQTAQAMQALGELLLQGRLQPSG